ncbi:MAG: hypothetical protein J5633_09160 [Oscillospiraceae bacterium]|nr:hypothetical protein [Oscillospiraceae bacterium]MBR4131575.1 hypothetical protein [Oscillospiraceae bacterium]
MKIIFFLKHDHHPASPFSLNHVKNKRKAQDIHAGVCYTVFARMSEKRRR